MVKVRNACCCPTFILSVVGPYMMISGAVLVDKVIVQPFTDYIWLGGDPFYTDRVKVVANIFHWLSHALDALRTFYDRFEPSEVPLLHRLLPYSTSYVVDDTTYKMEYIGRLCSDSKRAIFEARPLPPSEGKKLVVKFVEQYCAGAHRLLASHGLAPHLHYCAPVPGGLMMVVMDFVVSQDPTTVLLPQASLSIQQDINRAVVTLHEAGYVFGDLRDPNVLIIPPATNAVDAEFRAMLVDFDWCGKDGHSLYPVVLNDTGAINWHQEVVRGGKMKKDHDLHMLSQLTVML
jgi:hypothetical protein